jgi:hypothetical protein
LRTHVSSCLIGVPETEQNWIRVWKSTRWKRVPGL